MEYNSNPEKILNEIRTYLEERQFEVYDDVTGLCNPILSKNPFSSSFLTYFLNAKKFSITYVFFIKTNARFIFNSLKALAFEMIMIFLAKKKITNNDRAKIVLMSFFNYDRKEDSIFDELYFPNLQKELIEKNVPYLYFPKLYNFPRNPLKLLNEIKNIKKQNKAFVSPYELIPRTHVFKLIRLILGHYFRALKTLRLDSTNPKDHYYNQALLESLQVSEVYKFVHFLATKQLVKNHEIEKIILWYENQVIDKCTIKAVRTNPQVVIYGCQFFLISPQEQNLFPSKFEMGTNLIPDKIFLTQNPPLDSEISDRYFLGKGLRYLYLQKYELEKLKPVESDFYTLFLTIYKIKNEIAFSLLLKSFLKDKSIYIKKHPVNSKDDVPNIKSWKETDKNQEELLLQSEIVFCTDTGVVYEALALGRQVVILGSNSMPSHLIPPQKFKNKLWVFVTEPEEIADSINILKNFRKEHYSELLSLAALVREMFFKNSDKSIFEILELKN